MKKVTILIVVLAFSTITNSQNKLEATGNVGIGTTTPSEKLYVKDGNIGIYGLNNSRYIRFTEGKLQGSFINYDGTKNVLNIGVHEAASDGIEDDKNSISIVRSTGNVGIGTTAPNEKLYVKDGNIGIYGLNSSRYIRFTEGKLQGSFINYDGTKNVLNIGVHEANSDDIAHDKNSISIVRSTGNVGIGTTKPDAKLAVNGTIHTKEVKVDLDGWSDFVFENDYNLPTLTEVENHIKTKGHLQDIPSAKEVKKNGILLGKMDAKLLQKIEELTLYTIQQEKEIKELNQLKITVQQQQEEIKELKNLVHSLLKK